MNYTIFTSTMALVPSQPCTDVTNLVPFAPNCVEYFYYSYAKKLKLDKRKNILNL